MKELVEALREAQRSVDWFVELIEDGTIPWDPEAFDAAAWEQVETQAERCREILERFEFDVAL